MLEFYKIPFIFIYIINIKYYNIYIIFDYFIFDFFQLLYFRWEKHFLNKINLRIKKNTFI